jgi:hypothetical protein
VIHLIHGIHTGGPSPIEGLIPLLAPLAIAYPDYGYILGAETRVINPAVVGTLKPYVGEKDILICHSNGAAIAYDLMMKGTKVGGAIFINAALDTNIVLPPGCPWIDVYYNEGDTITEAAELGKLLGIDDPVWGEMGHAGYKGNNPNISSFNGTSSPGMSVVCGHSDFFNHLDWESFAINRRRDYFT